MMGRFTVCIVLLGSIICCSGSYLSAQESEHKSEWVFMDGNGRLVYKETPKGDRMVDFSHAGYKGGGVALPEVPVKAIVVPLEAGQDCTALLQAAIDRVACLEPDEQGFRGAVLLKEGVYTCSSSVVISTDGIVLRGSDKKKTVIKMTGGKHAAVVMERIQPVTKIRKRPQFEKKYKILDKYLPAGSRSFCVSQTDGLKVGNEIVVCKPVTAEWVHFMQMDDMVRNGKEQTWIKVGSVLQTERMIEHIEGNKITLTVPLVDNYDSRMLGEGAYIIPVEGKERLRLSGIENLTIQSPLQEINHTQALYSAVKLEGEDCWIKNVLAKETMGSFQLRGRRITMENVDLIREARHLGASLPSEFTPNGGQILIHKCSIRADRVFYAATGSGITGPIVILNCRFYGDGHVEGHQRWSTGLLVDNCEFHGGGIHFMNRGSMGSGHGWGMAWAVAWNCIADRLINQRPPGTLNWMIGCTGDTLQRRRPFAQTGPFLPSGIYDSHNCRVLPKSLYLQQLQERCGSVALRAIGY